MPPPTITSVCGINFLIERLVEFHKIQYRQWAAGELQEPAFVHASQVDGSEAQARDQIADGFDAAIGGGFDLPPGMVARELGRIHLIAVASPVFLRGKNRPEDPTGLAELAGVTMRSPLNGRVRTLVMRNSAGTEMAAVQKPVMMVNDPDALSRATLLGLGVGLVAVPHAAPHLESGTLERLLPDWHGDIGPLSLYFSSQKLLPAKTRAFVDFVTEAFRAQKLAQVLSVRSQASSGAA